MLSAVLFVVRVGPLDAEIQYKTAEVAYFS
jgi:hypothetical protein